MIRINISNNMNKIDIIVMYLNIPPDYKRNFVEDIFLELVLIIR